jgi:hypothetical protein
MEEDPLLIVVALDLAGVIFRRNVSAFEAFEDYADHLLKEV